MFIGREIDENQKLFDEAFFDKGGIFIAQDQRQVEYLNGFLLQLQDLINTRKHRNTYNQEKHPDVYINFINNNIVNAVACKFKGKYFIGIYIGAFYTHCLLTWRMCADPNILSQFGDSSREIQLPLFKLVEVESYDELQESWRDPNISLFPVDESRANLAQMLLMIVLKFTTLHELCHILCGHLDFKYKEDKLPITLHETIVEEPEPFDALTSQTLELDADSFAGTILLREMQFLVNNNHLLDADVRLFFTNEDQTLTLYTFAIYLNFRIFVWRILSEKDARTFSHPTPGMRQFCCVSQIITFYQSEKRNPETLAQSLVDTVINVEKALSIISEMEINVDSLQSGLDLLNYSREVTIHWEIIREKLKPFTYVRLAKFNFYDKG